MTDRELMQQALDALEQWNTPLYKRGNVITALRARLAQPEQEPVAWELNEVILNSIRDSSEIVAPPQREWQGLTDEEHQQIAIDCGCASADWIFYSAMIERKLKEKNT